MSALQHLNGLNGVGESEGRDLQHGQGGGEGGHLLLSASQKAIRELAYALEKDSDG